MTSALRVQPDVILNPDVEVRDITYPDRICGNSETAFTVQLYNAGQFTGIGTVELYIDGNPVGSTTIDIQPGELLNVPFQVDVPPSGSHQVKAVYDSKFSTRTRTETFEVNDNDCDGWLNEIELQQYTDPDNPDTDGDGVLDPDDMDPLSDLKVEIDVFRIRGLDALPDSSLGFRIRGKAIEGINEQNFSKTIFLDQNENDFEKYLPAGKSPLGSIQDQAIATIEVDVPDYWDSVTVTFNASIVMNDLSEVPLDISPQPDKREALLYFNVLTGTWSGDDAPNDHNVSYGYGHLSGAGDGSGSYSEGSGGYTEPFSKYYGDLEALGYNLSVVNITSVRGWDGLDEIDYRSSKGPVRVLKPAEVVEFTLKLPDGSIKRVLLINKHGARIVPFKPPRAPQGIKTDAPLDDRFKAELEKIKNGSLLVRGKFLTGSLPVPKNAEVYTVDSPDEDDAEIWFLVRVIDEDGDSIPHYRELGLNYDLEQNNYTKRFDPRKNDMYGDYDGDGVSNTAELFIGKDPAKPDVLGIKLSVAVGWDANQTYLTQLVKGFQRASQVIYDYTDGYAMIAEVNITNNAPEGSEEWRESMVRLTLNKTNPVTYNGFWYWKWVKNLDGKENGYIIFPWDWFNDPLNKGWYGGMAHELGHFVFGIGDEYEAPFYWNPNNDTTKFTYNDLKNLLANEYGIKFEKMKTVMEAGDLWTEISTPRDYALFKEQLENVSRELENKAGYGLLELINAHNSTKNITNLNQIMPTHWQNTYTVNGIHLNRTSAWEVVFALLAKGHTLSYKGVYLQDAGLYLDLDFDGTPDQELPKGYIPKVGPYTGVGYYMIANWG